MNKKLLAIIGGAGAGAALMYFMDPDRGGSRRAMVRDKATGLTNDLSESMHGKAENIKNRAQGLLHDATSVFKRGNGESGEGLGISDPTRTESPITH